MCVWRPRSAQPVPTQLRENTVLSTRRPRDVLLAGRGGRNRVEKRVGDFTRPIHASRCRLVWVDDASKERSRLESAATNNRHQA
jgi:hypothetical protein